VHNSSIPAFLLAASILVGGCGSDSGSTGNNTNPIATGGSASLGGTSASSGTALGGATNGGTVANGGTNAGGTVAAGGTSAIGGTTSSGGTAAAGGAVTGGSNAVGGTTAPGGTTSTGTKAAGGSTATGGTKAAGGGATSVGGTAVTGGTKAAGGTAATGGTKAAGGTAGSTASTGGGTNVAGSTSCPVVSDFATWPSGKGPSDIGKAAVNAFKSHTNDAYTGAGYAWTFAYVASLQFTLLTGDTTNNSYLISHFDCTQAGPDYSSGVSVDNRAFGDLPLEIFLENQSAQCKTLGMLRVDSQWANTADTAVTPDARYWSDDMFMITGLQDFGYRATKDQKYLSRTALTMVAYLKALQQSDGLMWHTKQTKAYWGRANGWFASGMALLLQDLPAGTDRDTIMAGYKKMMDGLLTQQIASGTDAGAWRQVLDRTDAGPEMSCTAMFTYALVTGIKNGWLTDAKYITAARNGWIALGNKTSNGQLSQVCPGTGQASDQAGVGTDLKSQQDYYIGLQSNFQAGDQHGQAPLLWAAIALLRNDCPGLR
jgi:unsaturated rhamnogalacturonyl hydrolase